MRSSRWSLMMLTSIRIKSHWIQNWKKSRRITLQNTKFNTGFQRCASDANSKRSENLERRLDQSTFKSTNQSLRRILYGLLWWLNSTSNQISSSNPLWRQLTGGFYWLKMGRTLLRAWVSKSMCQDGWNATTLKRKRTSLTVFKSTIWSTLNKTLKKYHF